MTPTRCSFGGSLFLKSLAYIAFAGLLGTIARYALQGWVQARAGSTTFPLGTLAVNLVGSLLAGLILRYATGTASITPDLRTALTIGFCGAFTTMSAFSYETVALLRDGNYWHVALYAGGTIVGCLAAVVAGAGIANRLL